ncbi:TM2 domain-containing protein [Bacillus mesophilus]|uniref:NINE protein n=1 Tax=Bacillus mesophilus TaxID=1808955 RepID=A0A6M0Q5K7_9BACI|nr:NINE protein [Bacillus mesophilus]
MSTKSKLTAALLGILLGGFGAHKFYLGRRRKGIVYLLFCWTYIPSILGFIEGVVYLFSSPEDFSMKYDKKYRA